MTNEITLVLIGSILLGLGALVGALIYHLIIFKFSKNLEKVLEKTIKNYEHYVLEKATNSLDEFQSIRNQLNNISTNIIKEQKNIYQSTFSISDNIDTFFRELKATQEIRVSLENEIIKLKNIINRKNKQNKEK